MYELQKRIHGSTNERYQNAVAAEVEEISYMLKGSKKGKGKGKRSKGAESSGGKRQQS